MLRRLAEVVFILTFVVDDIRSQRWSQDFGDGEMVYSCAGGQALFPWEAELGVDDVIVQITWTFHGVFSTATMATYSNQAFFVSEDYADRVQQVGITGIVLSKLTNQDTGKYSVKISAHNSSSFFFTTIRHAGLQVGDKLMAVDHRVRASQLAEAQQDDAGRWSVALACGHFTHLTLPPFKVEWTTPSGDTVPPTRYEDGHFILVLPNPVKGGNYTCSLPQLFVQDACADDTAVREGRTEDTVMVDETKARVSLLEAHVVSLLEENRDLQNKVDTLKAVEGRTSHRLEDIEDTLEKEVSGWKAADTNTSRILGSLEDTLEKEVSGLKAADTNTSRILGSLEDTLEKEVSGLKAADTNTSHRLKGIEDTLEKEVSGLKAADTNTCRKLKGIEDTLEKEVSGLKAADTSTSRILGSLEDTLDKEVSGLKAADTNTSRKLKGIEDTLEKEVNGLKAADTNTSHKLKGIEDTLEKEVNGLKAADTNTSQILGSLEDTLDKEVSGLKAADTNTSQILGSLQDTLEKEVNDLKAADVNTCRELASLEAKWIGAGKQIEDLSAARFSFNVRLSSDRQLTTSKQKLKWDKVILNEGNAYDPNTGIFTAPVNGMYFFAVTTTTPYPKADKKPADADIMADDVTVCRIDSYADYDVGSCQGAVELSKGQRVWVQSLDPITSFKASASSFTGFLSTHPLGDTGMSTPWFGFNARLSSDANYVSYTQTLQWDKVIFNKGRAYDPDTGIFTAPLSGLYVFAVTTRSPSRKANVHIMAGDVRVCRIDSKRAQDAGSCQGAVELSRGQHVWVQSYNTGSSFRAKASTFTGFLYTHSLGCADLTTQPSIFNVRLSSDKNITNTIVWDEVIVNHGQAYNSSTGSFTAPISGHYFFAVTTTRSRFNPVYANIMAGDVAVCRVHSLVSSDAGSCQGAVHLDKGHRVWVEFNNKTRQNFLGEVSSFTGFLIKADSD